MYIGSGIFLLVIGAILSFAIGDSMIGPVKIHVVGYICMAAGVLAILLSLVMRGGGYRSRRVVQVDPRTGNQIDETRVDGL